MTVEPTRIPELDEVEGLDVQKFASLATFLSNVSTEDRMTAMWLQGKQSRLIDESGLSHEHKEILRRGNLREIDEAVKTETGGHTKYAFVFVRNEA